MRVGEAIRYCSGQRGAGRKEEGGRAWKAKGLDPVSPGPRVPARSLHVYTAYKIVHSVWSLIDGAAVTRGCSPRKALHQRVTLQISTPLLISHPLGSKVACCYI